MHTYNCTRGKDCLEQVRPSGKDQGRADKMAQQGKVKGT